MTTYPDRRRSVSSSAPLVQRRHWDAKERGRLRWCPQIFYRRVLHLCCLLVYSRSCCTSAPVPPQTLKQPGRFKPSQSELRPPGSPERQNTTARPTTKVLAGVPHGEAAACPRTFATQPTHERVPLPFKSGPDAPAVDPLKREGAREGSPISSLHRFSLAISSVDHASPLVSRRRVLRSQPIDHTDLDEPRGLAHLRVRRWLRSLHEARRSTDASCVTRSDLSQRWPSPRRSSPTHPPMAISAFATSGSARSTRAPCCRTLAP